MSHKEDYTGSAFDQEDTVILKDNCGCYYAIPAKHIPLNMIKPAFQKNIEALGKPRSSVTLDVVGVFPVSKSLRRAWTAPFVRVVDAPVPSPTS